MAREDDLFSVRKPLGQVCEAPDHIISVYTLERHIWADSNSEEARATRKPELQTVEEFQFDPVRPFLMDILRNMAAPYRPEDKSDPVGQGYWIQAEFGSGKSHLLSCLAALALGDQEAWDIVQRKEKESGRGKRESLYRFWDEGLKAKSKGDGKGIFVVMKTLVGQGGGVVGHDGKGGRLVEYILDAAKEQIQLEIGENLSLYPVELLADRFLSQDLDRYRKDLKKFLSDPRFFEEDEQLEIDEFLEGIQSNKSPEYKRDCGDKLWQFYTDYLQVRPSVAAETEDILRHLVETLLAQGYSGVLIVLDEVSLFMKDRDEDQRTDDEKTLVTLSNRLAKIHNLPVWTVCAAQQQIESKMGAKNIIADDRLKLVELLKDEADYYDIVLSRVRDITDPSAINAYYLHYKRGFTWPNSIGEKEFARFFPFHKPAIEVVRALTYELTTARSAIHFMHQTLKHQIKEKGAELIRLWEMFDDAVTYEEDPSGVHAGIAAVRTKREVEYRMYEKCRNQIDSQTKGALKVYRDRSIKTLQTLFLFHLARTRPEGLDPEEIANSVLIERDDKCNPDENIQHYENLADKLRGLMPQILVSTDEDGRARYRFEPVSTGGITPAEEFQQARDLAETNEQMQNEAWKHLLALDEWPIKTRQLTFDLTSGVKSIFRDVAQYLAPWEDSGSAKYGDQKLELNWRGREVTGLVGMRDLGDLASNNRPLPPINSSETDLDFAVFIGERPVTEAAIDKLLANANDPRVILWSPAELSADERGRLLDFAAYRKLVEDWQGKDSEDALAVINWVSDELKKDLARIKKAVDNCYGRGQLDAANHRKVEPQVAGELASILAAPVDKVLTGAYESSDLAFDPPFLFRSEEAVKVINGIVRTGEIPKGTKPNKNISAAQNFGFGLKIMKKSAERKLDASDNAHVADMLSFLEDKLTDEGQTMPMETLYKNFMGLGGPKDYGLTRRMVQLYLLCQVQSGQIRLQVGSKSGLGTTQIDYSNLAEIEFSAKVLNNLQGVQLMAKPENWEVLRPYAEKLLGKSIDATADDALIQETRSELRELFGKSKPEADETVQRAGELFSTLDAANPYDTECGQVAKLYETDLESGDDIDRLLFGLGEAFGYEAFTAHAASQAEVDDLANRLRNYQDVRRLLEREQELRTGHAYCSHPLPESKALKPLRKLQRTVADKLENLQPFIDDEVRLRSELIGHRPRQAGDKDTIADLIEEYSGTYLAAHDKAQQAADEALKAVQGIVDGDEMQAFRTLEGVSALQPASADKLAKSIESQTPRVIVCPNAARADVENDLRLRPIHECGLSLVNHQQRIADAKDAARQAQTLFDQALEAKLQVFLNETIRERLEQGKDDETLAGILKCKDLAALRSYLLPAVGDDPKLVDRINKYLKKVQVKKVRLSDFRPTVNPAESGQIDEVTQEFREFLQSQLKEIEGGSDTLPMLQLE